MENDFRIKREKVEKIVRELFEGDKGKKMNKKAMELKKLAEEVKCPLGWVKCFHQKANVPHCSP